MKTTVDIPEEELREALVAALVEFNRRRRLRRLTESFGTLEGLMTREELGRMREEP